MWNLNQKAKHSENKKKGTEVKELVKRGKNYESIKQLRNAEK